MGGGIVVGAGSGLSSSPGASSSAPSSVSVIPIRRTTYPRTCCRISGFRGSRASRTDLIAAISCSISSDTLPPKQWADHFGHVTSLSNPGTDSHDDCAGHALPPVHLQVYLTVSIIDQALPT